MLALVMAPKDPNADPIVQVNLRVPRSLVDAVDALVARRNEAAPWARAMSRNDAIREAVVALLASETPAAKPKRAR